MIIHKPLPVTRRERVVKAVGRGMLAWASIVMPFMSIAANAQGLPGQATTTQQQQDALRDRKTDEATSDTLINQRASKILSGKYNSTAPIRGPRTDASEQTPRNPNLTQDPNAQARALRQAQRAGTRTTEEIVRSAESGSAIGQSVYEKADNANQDNRNERVEPGVNQTTSGRANIRELVPGFNDSESAQMQNLGSTLYQNPALTKDVAEQNRRNLRRDGCRKTEFVMRERQDITRAATGATHRILKVEFFDLVKEPIPGTNPVEYQTITKPSTYKGGALNLSVATLGATSTIYWEKVNDSHTVKYTYTPFSNSRGANYFTYNHKLAYSNGGALQNVNNAFASFGTPADQFKPVLTFTMPAGVTAVYLSADLYQTKVTYSEPAQGVPCPPDPPEVCEVPSIGGDTLRWCPGSPGANVASMYDDVQFPSADRQGKGFNDQAAANFQRKDYSGDSMIRGGVTTGLNAANSNKAQELVGQCVRDSISHIENVSGGSYGVPNMQLCSETLVNPYPQGCTGIKRSFGMSYLGEHNFLTVKAFNKIKEPIIDPATGKQVKDADGNPLYTYRKEPINVSGAIDTNFTIMGAAQCPGQGRCSTEIPDDPLGTSEGRYLEYIHYPMGGEPKAYAFDGVYVQGGGVSNYSSFGLPSQSWLPTGTASGDGSLHELRLMAKAYSVTINTFAGCEKYLDYVADGFCKGGKLTCKATSATRTIGGVTFGPGLPNQGIVELLKNWGTSASTTMPDSYDNGSASDPVANGPAIKMIDDQMCWEADAESFTSCSTMSNEKGTLRSFMRDGQQWATDCNLATDPKGVPLESSGSCKRVPAADSCDTRFKGPFTGQCYNPTIAYDCGVSKDVTIPVVVEEVGDTCSGAMRCTGTECHRPNLTGSHGADFVRAASAMEAVNAMVDDMVCAETGEKPTSVTQACTPYIFGGKAMYCKIPIGNEIGLTPNCCKEARENSSSAPSWMEYLSAMMALSKIAQRTGVLQAMQGSDIYSHVSSFFGEIKQPVVDAYSSASQWVTDKFITPFRAGFDNLFGGAAANVGPDAAAKGPLVDGLIDGFKNQLMGSLHDILVKIGGEELAGQVVVQTGVTETGGRTFVFTQGVQNLVMAFQIYSIARLIGHIIFACKQEEYEWGMNERWRLCTFADSCCNKKVPLLGCVEKRQLYCCYKSIATRVISTQIISKNLTGSRPRGFRSANDGSTLGGCSINCGGFTAFELAAVDWSQVDLNEWTDALIEGGQINPTDPGTNYGIGTNTIKESMVVARDPDPQGNYSTNVPAQKSAELLGKNTDKVMENTQILREVEEHCYGPDNQKMPFAYPGCKKSPP